MNKKTLLLSVLSLCFLSTNVFASNVSTPNDMILKLYPVTSGSFWSVLSGAKAEVLFKAKKDRYYGLILGASYANSDADRSVIYEEDESSLYSNKDNAKVQSYTIGASITDYIKPSGFVEMYTKKLVSFEYGNQTNDSTYIEEDSSYTDKEEIQESQLTFQYNLGLEKTIWNQFGLGVEINLVNVSYADQKITTNYDEDGYNDNQSQTIQGIEASLFNQFEVYVRYKF